MSQIAPVRPPGPPARDANEIARAFRRDPVGTMQHLSRTYGDITHFKVGWQDIFLLTHPDDIKEVLVNRHRHFIKGVGPQNSKLILGDGLFVSEGDFHRRQRRLLQPTMAARRLQRYAPLIVEFSSQLAERWSDGLAIDANEAMMRLAQRIVGKAIFDTDVEESRGAELSRNVDVCMRVSEMKAPPSVVAESEEVRGAVQSLDDLVYGLIDEKRRSDAGEGEGVISMLLSARDNAGDGTGLTDRQIRDELLTLLVAGHESSANTMTWAWYFIAADPRVEGVFHQELDRILGGRTPTFEDNAELEYTRAIFAETLRMYPQVPFLDRRVVTDFPLRDYVFPAGSIVLMSQYVTQHDPRFFPDPESFRPERWLGVDLDARNYAYFPFSAGNRVCLGEPFAWMEGTLVLATLGQRWRMRLIPGHHPEPARVVSLRPVGGMPMSLEKR